MTTTLTRPSAKKEGRMAARSAANKAGKRAARRNRPGYVFILPAVALFALFFVYPLLSSLIQSFQSVSGGQTAWVGFAQYQRLFEDPLVARSLFNVFLILLIQVPLMVGIAIALGYILNQSWIRFSVGFRAIYFLPAVTTLVAYSLVFRVMLATDGGAANQMLGMIGLDPIDWLNSVGWSRVALIASITWRWTGYNMIIILAGLQAIPAEQYEAARIDGAGRWAVFSRIVVPQLRPVILFSSITSTIGALQLFDENFILTGGGPNNATLTPVLYLYKVGFQQFDFGYASAIAWLVVAIIAIISVIQFRIMRDKS